MPGAPTPAAPMTMPRLSVTISVVPCGSTRSPAMRPTRERFSDPLMMPSRTPAGVTTGALSTTSGTVRSKPLPRKTLERKFCPVCIGTVKKSFEAPTSR